MSKLRKIAKKSTFFALEPSFFEIFQNRQNRRVLHVSSFPKPYYMWKLAKKLPSYAKKLNKLEKSLFMAYGAILQSFLVGFLLFSVARPFFDQF